MTTEVLPIMSVPGSNQPISFSLFLYACVLVNHILFFPNTHIHTTNMDLNLAWRTHIHARVIYFGDGRAHDLTYFVNVQSKSKVLGHLTTQHVILISTSVWVHTYVGSS